MSGTSTSKSDVLSNQDLLDIIFAYLLEDSPPATAAQTPAPGPYRPRWQLLQVALSCKDFRDAAIGVLWSSIDTLLPLLKLFSAYTSANDICMFNGAITDDDWATVKKYGRRIKTITFPPQQEKVSTFLYQMLMHSLQTSGLPFFPMLRGIHVNCSASSDYSGAFFVISPSLEFVEVTDVSQSGEDIEFLQQFIASLAAQATNLSHVTIKGRGDAKLVGPLHCLSGLRRLSNIDLQLSEMFISLRLLENLSSLPALETLTIHCGNITSGLQQRRPRHGPWSSPFPMLSHAHLIGDPSNIARILSNIISPRLTKIKFDASQNLDPQRSLVHWSDFFQLLARDCSRLQSIEVTERQNADGDHTLSLPIISPLLDLSNIEELHLDVSSISGSGEVIETISASCPNLKSLVLPAWNAGPDPGLGCITSLARSCPHLEALSLCLDLSIDVANSRWECRGPPHPLKQFLVSDARGNRRFSTDKATPIARFIDKEFPMLQKFGMYRDSRGQGQGNEAELQRIGDLIRAFRETRQEAISMFLLTQKGK